MSQPQPAAKFGPFARPGVTLAQRGRSGMEMLGSLQKYVASQVRGRARAEFDADPEAQAMARTWKDRRNDPWSDRIAKAKAIAEKSNAYRYERLMQRYVAEEVYVRSVPAAELRRKEAEALAAEPIPPAGGTLELDPTIKAPAWQSETEWHLMPGGWDGYDLMGTAGGGIMHVFRHGGYAAVEVGDNIGQQRIDVVKCFPKKSYGRIYEPGCGGAGTMSCVHQVFPEAELVASDLSTYLLKNGHKMAEKLGFKVAFKQRDCRDTREPSASFDGVIMYALQHEMPVDACVDSFKEAFRILKPGGDLVMNDPPPFSAVDPLQAVVLGWDTEHRGEPFFTVTREVEFTDVLKDIGFINVEGFALGKYGYPWVVRGTKPL